MMAKPRRASGSITLSTPGPITKETPLDWSWVIQGTSGREYPMVIVRVVDAAGAVLYARLDHPDVRPWIIGDGSCPWLDPANPSYGKAGIGQVQLWVYGSNDKTAPEYKVAETPTFPVGW